MHHLDKTLTTAGELGEEDGPRSIGRRIAVCSVRDCWKTPAWDRSESSGDKEGANDKD